MTDQFVPPPYIPGYSQQPMPPSAPEPPRRSRAVPILVAAVVVLLAGVAALAFVLISNRAKPAAGNSTGAPAAAATFSVTGTMELKAGQFISDDNQSCRGQDGYDDLTMGASVTITDASGTVVALGEVNSMHNDDGMAGACDLGFKVDGVPAGKGFYGVEVSHRGAVKEPEAELKAGSVQLTIG